MVFDHTVGESSPRRLAHHLLFRILTSNGQGQGPTATKVR